MLIVIVGTEKESRRTPLATTMSQDMLPMIFDDTTMSFGELESFAYPSLFETTMPVVWGKFLLDRENNITAEKIKALAMSKTFFILEEFTILADTKKLFEKHGAQVFVQKKEPKGKEENSMFGIVQTMIGADKKARWLGYQRALQEEIAPEALIGILYWKLRQMIGSARGESGAQYKKMYTAYISAHAHAWKTGTPLGMLIEKVLLEE